MSLVKALALALVLAVAAPALGRAAYDRDAPYSVPDVYFARLDFHIPYIGFTENVEVSVDSNKQSMRLSYFGGMDVYMFTPENMYSIVPVYRDNAQSTVCMETGEAGTPVHVFPDMQYFAPNGTQQKITTRGYPKGVLCDVWSYTYGTPQHNSGGDSNSTLPNADGYVGHYEFLVNAANGMPVAFRARYGHNVVLGGSHYDEYQLDYVHISPMDSEAFDEHTFAPPSGMQCFENGLPTGPTRMRTRHGDLTRSHPGHDLEMLFPRGHARREGLFAEYAEKFGKTYADEGERVMRAGIFHNNVRFINAHNRRGLSFTTNLNHMADWTESEKASLRGFRGASEKVAAETTCQVYKPAGGAYPDSVDWRSKAEGGTQDGEGLVNPAKDQGTCGSCWTFGATAAGEAAYAKKHGKLIRLSQQNLLDCTWDMGNMACDGGTDYLGYRWLMEHNGGKWASDESYGGYLNQNGYCHYAVDTNLTTNPWNKTEVEAGITIDQCYHVTDQYLSVNKTVSDAEAVANLTDALVHQGVLSVAIDATLPTFYFYESGYYYDPKCGNTQDRLDHQVTAVGYTTYKGQKYSIIQNSWSNHWGMNGYVYMSMKDNNCGVGTTPTFVTIK